MKQVNVFFVFTKSVPIIYRISIIKTVLVKDVYSTRVLIPSCVCVCVLEVFGNLAFSPLGLSGYRSVRHTSGPEGFGLQLETQVAGTRRCTAAALIINILYGGSWPTSCCMSKQCPGSDGLMPLVSLGFQKQASGNNTSFAFSTPARPNLEAR